MLTSTQARTRIVELVGQESVVSGGSLVRKGGRFGFGKTLLEPSPSFEMSMCEVAGIPHNFYRKLTPSLQASILAEVASGKDKYKIIVRNGKADSLCRFNDMHVPVLQVMDKVIEILDNPTFEKIYFDKGLFTLEAVSRTAEVTPKKGDISKGGVFVRLGQFDGVNFRISVGSFIFRLVCSNGLLRRETDNTFVIKKLKTPEEAIERIGALVSQTYEAVEKIYLKEFADTANFPVSDPATLVSIVSKEASVPQELVGSLMAQATSLKDATVYDIVDIVTKFANQHEWARYKLLSAGGRLVNRTINRCGQCHRAL